jgi:hypothetical protein
MRRDPTAVRPYSCFGDWLGLCALMLCACTLPEVSKYVPPGQEPQLSDAASSMCLASGGCDATATSTLPASTEAGASGMALGTTAGFGASGGDAAAGETSQGAAGTGMTEAAAEPDSGSAAASGCAPNELMCSTGCVPNDARNCGRCGHDCTALPHVSGPVSCSAGSCVIEEGSCAPGWDLCSPDTELGCNVDITQPSHCGNCHTACDASAPLCSEGKCVTGCSSDAPTLCSGSCVNTDSDANACGACDRRCTTNVAHAQPTCRSGECTFTCSSGYTECSGACVDTDSDSDNCGGCGVGCSGGKECRSGSCECSGGLQDCRGECVRPTTVEACGSSCEVCRTNVANASPTCEGGTCSFSCDSGFTACGNSCVDTSSDPENCGRCGRSCPGPRTEPGVAACYSGQCAVDCDSGYGNCGDDCLNTKTDPSHCGLCDEPCPAGWSCANFQCIAP